MKKISLVIMCIASLLLLANWSSDETTIDGHKKQSVNFYGTLTTQQGQSYEVENIAFGHRHDQIPVYEPPLADNAVKNEKKGNENDSKYALSDDPKDGIVTKIDLSEVSEIQIPHADVVWTYQKRKGFRSVEYLEIVIISNDQNRTKNNYLIDLRRKLTCDQANPAGPIEQEVPVKAIKSLVIKGYKYRDEKKEKNSKNKASKKQAKKNDDNDND